MGNFGLKTPFSSVRGNGGFSTLKRSFPGIEDSDPCKGSADPQVKHNNVAKKNKEGKIREDQQLEGCTAVVAIVVRGAGEHRALGPVKLPLAEGVGVPKP